MTASSPTAARLRNWAVAIVAIVLSAALFFGLRAGPAGGGLAALAAAAVPLDEAIANGKPTLVEFYADWCVSCQAMAGEMRELKQTYGDRVNFSLLNVDNTKWLPEILRYRVDGIPHFVFLDRAGKTIAQAIGEQPATVLAANLTALAQGATELPQAQAALGQTSPFAAPLAGGDRADPRSHGSDVVAP